MKHTFKTGILAASLFTHFAGAADLMEIYAQAKENDEIIASSKASYEAGKEKLPQGRALLLPNINLNASLSQTDLDIQYRDAANFPSGNYNYASQVAAFSLSQPLYRRQNLAGYQQAKHQDALNELQYTAAQHELMMRVAQTYGEIMLAQENAAQAYSQKMAILEQLSQAKMSFELGKSTITDTHEAQARHDFANSTEIAALADLQIKQNAMEKLLGKPSPDLAALVNEVPLLRPDPFDVNKWVQMAEESNLQIKLQRAALEIANQEVVRQRGGHHPTVDLVASYNDSSADGSMFGTGIDMKEAVIGVQVSLPIYQGGATSSKIRESIANKEKAQRDLNQAIRQAGFSTREAYTGVVSGSNQVRALELALQSSENSLSSTRKGQEIGVRTNVDVLNAQQQLFIAKLALYKSRYSYLFNRLKLKYAVGLLSDEDLGEINQWLK
jgi:outer membrane protein